jgi:hypothetical protein
VPPQLLRRMRDTIAGRNLLNETHPASAFRPAAMNVLNAQLNSPGQDAGWHVAASRIEDKPLLEPELHGAAPFCARNSAT